MYPPYQLTHEILHLLSAVSEKLGEVRAIHMDRPSPELRKRNRIKTINASLEIEGNTLSEEQITAIVENKRVLAPPKDIQEVQNAIKTYEALEDYTANSTESFLAAHSMMMQGLVDDAGKFRIKQVGIMKGNEVSHLAPPADQVPALMNKLFNYVSESSDHPLIKSCVVHYEIEFIHPFMDGNGRLGRLWQTVILLEKYPVFEFLPFETMIKKRQEEYYKVLEQSDNAGESTVFISFMLSAIYESLQELLAVRNRSFSAEERIEYFISIFSGERFTRKEYMTIFKDISQATASRDLRYATEIGRIQKFGDKRNTHYRVVK